MCNYRLQLEFHLSRPIWDFERETKWYSMERKCCGRYVDHVHVWVKGCCNIIYNAFCLKESCMPTIKYNSSRSYIHLCESSHSVWVDRNIACKTSFLNDQGSEKVFWNVIGLCVTRSKPTNVSWLRKRSFVQLAFNGEIVNKIKYAIIYLEVWTELTWDHGLSRLRLKVKGLGLSLVLFFHL